MQQGQNTHVPVLLEPILNNLPEKLSNNNFFDGTFGGGGYSKRFLEQGYNVFACDLDQTALDKKNERICSDLLPNLVTKQANFAEYINNFEDNFFTGIVLDLGFSSNQLTYSNRGFSYQNVDEDFDLRYNISSNSTTEPAYKKIAKLKRWEELGKVIYTYSGDNFSGKIARHIVEDKIQKGVELKTVGDFVNVITESIPAKFKNKTNATLSRVWQAIRIWVNGEFEALERFLPIASKKLTIGGRLYVVCFHSLEDKIVTKFMRQVSKKYFVDDYGNQEQDYRFITSKPIVPSEDEITQNIRSRSATLRIIERVK